MPPTISLTVGSEADEELEPPLLLEHAATPRASAPAATVQRARLNMTFLSLGTAGRIGPESDGDRFGAARRPPAENPLFQQGDQELGDERDYRHDRHAREHGVHVEIALRLTDDQPDAVLRTEHLRDECADDREAECGVQAGDD